MMFACVFVTFPYCVSGEVWELIASNPDLCILLYFQLGVVLTMPILCFVPYTRRMDKTRTTSKNELSWLSIRRSS